MSISSLNHYRQDKSLGNSPCGHHFLSIDVEDVVIAAADLHLKTIPAGYQDNIEDELSQTLDILSETGSFATFFVNGQYCKKYDTLIKEIVSRGHTLASHGFRHYDVRVISLNQFQEDLLQSLEALTKYQPDILGYRPPAFTMPFDDEHLSVLCDAGIKYISCGAAFGRSNNPHCDKPFKLRDGLTYIPISVSYFLGRRVRYPIGYGHVSRLMPERIYISWLRSWLSKHNYFQFYFHPYEIRGLHRNQKKSLYKVKKTDVAQRIYSQRCSNRSAFFFRILNMCNFRQIESMEGLS